MAIVKMNKLSLIGLDSSKSEIIEELMNLGVVEINAQEQKLSDEDWASVVVRDGNDNEVVAVEAELAKVSTVLDTIEKYNTEKKPLFKTRRVVKTKMFDDVMGKKSAIEQNIEKVYSLNERLNKLKAEENRLNGVILSIKPWASYDLPVDFTGTKSTAALIGVIPSIAEPGKLDQEFSEADLYYTLNVIGSDTDQHYISVIYHRDCEESIMDIIKQYGFNRMQFKDLTGTVSENLSKIDSQLKAIANERQEIEKEITEQVPSKSEIEAVYDSLIMRRDKAKVLGRMLKTQKAFYLDGWLPGRCANKVKAKLEEYDCIVDIEAPEDDEECPVMIKNNALSRPFEAITNLYSLPNCKEVDPTALLAPFYFIFFGMMLSDAGYGFVIALSCFLILRKFRLEGMAQRIISMLMFCGVSTFFWGVLFGGWFGDVVKQAGETFFNADVNIPSVWFTPVEDPMRLLIFSFILGVIHIFLGMGVNAYLKIKHGKPLDALFDEGSWFVFLIGLGLLLFGDMVHPMGGAVGKYMSIIGAVALILTQGRTKKGIISKFFSGVLSLYDVTGYLADVLSYSRLLALGLATGVIASVVNTMGTLAGGSVVGAIIFVVVFVFGHIFNLAINALGSFVHACRLQYVEFFGKFFEGGGRPFEPFKKNTKYVDIISEEEIVI